MASPGTHSYINLVTLSPVFPIELIGEVALHLPHKDRVSMIYTCWPIHNHLTRLVYRQVIVSSFTARSFFKTIANSDMNYGKYVRELSYFVKTKTDVDVTYSLLCEAIPRMERLQEFTLGAHHSYAVEFVRFFNARAQSIIHPTSQNSCRCNTTLSGCYSNIFMNFETLNLHGSTRLLDITRNCNLTSILVAEPMDRRDFAYFVNAVTTGTRRNYLIRRLVLSFEPLSGLWITSSMRTLSSSFPNLESLVIRTRYGNALEASHAMSIIPPIFPHLRSFYLNEWSNALPVFLITRGKALTQQKEHVVAAGKVRTQLESLDFGVIRWERVRGSEEWSMYQREVDSRNVYENNTKSDLQFPLFWELRYRLFSDTYYNTSTSLENDVRRA